MPSTYPTAPDDLSAGNTGLTHGQVSDALAAVQATLGVNPQGDAATVVARLDTIGPGLDGRTILSGSGAPASGSGLDPLDGVSDPWRWSTLFGGWVGPAVEVTVAAGATLDLLGETLPAGAADVTVFVTSATTIRGYGGGDALVDTNAGYGFSQAGSGSDNAGGTGIAFVLQSETGYAGPNAVPDATIDITTLLTSDGTGITVGAPFVFADVQTGVDGDFYINTTASALYGPKAGTWPSPVSLIGPAGADAPDPLIVTDPDAVQWRIVVDNTGALSTEPA